jgi:transposase
VHYETHCHEGLASGQCCRTSRAACREWVKQYRRVATRHGKLAANYLAFIQLGSIPPS